MKSTCKLHGIVPPVVTPLRDPETLDEPGLERLVDHLLQGGVHGLFILGTTGEAPGLGSSLRKRMVECTCKLVNGRVPVLVGISDPSFTESLRLADYAGASGATGLVIAPPYYFPAGQPELLEYLGHLVPRLPLPLYLYNMPAMTKISFDPDTVRQAFTIPGIVGMKDSSGSMAYMHKVKSLLPADCTASLLVGSEELLGEAVLFGYDGGVCGGANVFPRLYVELYEAASRRDLQTTLALHWKVIRLGQLLYGVGRFGSSAIKGIKCALSCLGICDDFMSEPFHSFLPPERNKIAAAVDALKKELEP
jgi:4-hydroxy-tetrahydrodipicolinate synthase